MTEQEPCELLREYLAANLGRAQPEALPQELSDHMASCESCQEELHRVTRLSAAVKALTVTALPADGELRIRSALNAALAGAGPGHAFGPVLTVEELARYLQVRREQVYEALEELPAFEFAGEVRFLRTSIDDWIRERERQFRRQTIESSVRRDRVLRLA
jgi:excisionase family DNA binding protein